MFPYTWKDAAQMRGLVGTSNSEIVEQVVMVTSRTRPALSTDLADELADTVGLGLDMSTHVWEHLCDRHSEPWQRDSQTATRMINRTALDSGDFTLVALDAIPGSRPKTGASA